MDRKEAILAKKNWSSEYPNYMAESEIHTAMDEYASEQAVAFAEYLSGEGWREYDGADRWINTQEGNAVLETKQLYEKFTNQQHGKL